MIAILLSLQLIKKNQIAGFFLFPTQRQLRRDTAGIQKAIRIYEAV